jgi:hypothetical protein
MTDWPYDAAPVPESPLAEDQWPDLPTYAPDATECEKGHSFRSEADCVLPEGWDHFMCRRCVQEASS